MDNSFLHRKKLLLVDDEPDLLKMVTDILKDAGFETVLTAASVKEAVMVAKQEKPDLMILDVMLPDGDGFSLMEQLRTFTDVPVIFLTALQDVTDKVKGLRLGAEDYIVKPFEAVELLARIEVVLRRSHKGRVQIVYDDITIDMDRHLVTKAGEPVALTPKEFSLLAFFMENVDVAVTRERLLAAVWGYEFQGESRTVDIHVQQLRKKLDLSRRLITIPKLGYRLESR